MQAHQLIPHPAVPAKYVSGVTVSIRDDHPNWLRIRWRVEGAQSLVLPKITSKRRADGLWKTTCFELFVKPVEGDAYSEWNFSPSRQWNAYDFDAPREGMRSREVEQDPDGVIHPGSKFALFDVSIPWRALPDVESATGIAAVIEEEGGVLSYWSLCHMSADKPDFHDPACFTATLAPPLHS